MGRVLEGYRPEKLYWYFEEMTRIPRGSKNEKAAADFICGEAKKEGLEAFQDEWFNVLVKKPGCGGLENEPPVILQGHTDVVCEKNEGVKHDFTRDPVELFIEDGWLKTRGTTLGADNGLACAMMLALMAEKDGRHPPLELFFTAQEEIGMIGARNFDYSKIRGRTLINMDGGSTKNVTVSCAGSEYDRLTFSFDRSPADGETVEVFLTGLMGGHSGTKARLGRANSIVLMGRVLSTVREKVPFRLSFISGGNKANAIPRECRVRAAVKDPAAFTSEIEKAFDALRRELVEADRGLEVTVDRAVKEAAFSEQNTEDLLFFLNLIPNGVLSTVPDNPDLVETSANAGLIRTEGDQVVLTVMPRSSSESRLDEFAHRLDLLACRAGCAVEHNDRHPGWEFARESRLRDVYRRVYEEATGEEPTFKALHAGLECGVISAALGGNVDAIAIGSRSMNAHTPDEKMDIANLAETYAFLKKLLAAL